jgi:hypothetical protein
MSNVKAKQAEREQAIESLRRHLKPGDKVTTTVLHVSRSGMSRSIMCQALMRDGDGTPYIGDITRMVARVIGERMDDRGGVKVGGCGMDMCFHTVYTLGRALFRDGFGVEGTHPDKPGRKRRPKTQAEAARMVRDGWVFRGRNGDAPGWDRDGGYALEYR